MLKKRLQKEAILHEKYTDFMADLLQKSYARKVTTEEQLQGEKWYLPHHPVFRLLLGVTVHEFMLISICLLVYANVYVI